MFSINNIYVRVGNRIFKQTIGIPMGTDCVPLLANLLLFFMVINMLKINLRITLKKLGWSDIQSDILMTY